jgi:GNAT superfamily N-acetyltransferase
MNHKFQFPNSQETALPEKACKEDTIEICRFWNNYYKGDNWKFSCKPEDVVNWMDQGFILVLRENFNSKREIVATFVCRIIKGGVICGSHIPQAGILDGFVVNPRLRGKGLASYMLAAMDKEVYSMPSMSNSILVWFREHGSSINSALQSPIAILDYSYIKLSDIRHTEQAIKASPEIVESCLKLLAGNFSAKFTILSNNFTDPDLYWFQVNSAIVGIADTHRISDDGFSLWEVIFAANLNAPHFENLQFAIMNSAVNLPCTKGILFATNGKARGNIGALGAPWVSGKSGCLSMHVYNWMPPTFITGDIFFPHSFI